MINALRFIRVSFADDDAEEIIIPILERGDARFLSSEVDVPVILPTGEMIAVYAEVGLSTEVADVSISVVENERVTAVRCGHAAILSYTTVNGHEVLIQVGSGPWE